MRLTRIGALLVVLLMLAVAAASSADARPLHAFQQPAPSLFGLNTGTFDDSYARFVRDLPTARGLGAKWVEFSGANVKFSRGRPNFRQMDSQVNRARARGLGVMMALGGTPAGCSLRPRPTDVTTCPPTTSGDLRAYRAYLRQLLAHFRGRVDRYESWLEPNHASFWPPAPNAAAYARLLLAEYRVFRTTDHHRNKLIFAGIGGPALPYLQAVLAALGGRPAFDLVGNHAYRFPPASPEVPSRSQATDGRLATLDWAGELMDYEDAFTAQGYGHPRMWLTEFGWPGNAANSGDAYHPNEQSQAAALAGAYRLLKFDRRLSFVEAAFAFNLRDYRRDQQNPDPEFFGHYGLLHNDFSFKPAASVFVHFAHGGA
jgi:hypothetical protein